jgi:rfaE bifunctional protein kinase chain/domain
MLRAGVFRDVRVLVVGDVMLDRYWFGEVERISPEAPVPVVNVARTEERPGGAANVARNVTALGARCALLSVVGDDDDGRSLRRMLDESAVESRLCPDADYRTTVKLRVIGRHQQLLRADFEATPSHEVLARCLAEYRRLLEEANAVILSDYGKGGLAHIRAMIELARECGVPVVVDPKGRDFTRYRGATALTPNLHEFETVAGPCENDLGACVAEMVQELDLGGMLVTQGERGMTLFPRIGAPLHSPARAKEVFDVTGAGDTVIAAYTVALAAGFAASDRLLIANAAAAIVVGKLGTATATESELVTVLRGAAS